MIVARSARVEEPMKAGRVVVSRDRRGLLVRLAAAPLATNQLQNLGMDLGWVGGIEALEGDAHDAAF